MLYHLPKSGGRFSFIGQERNEDGRNPSLKNFYYFARGVKFDNQDYTAKCVFVKNDKGQIFYDQSLSSIEKGNLIEMIKNKSIVSNNGLDVGSFNLVNTKDSPNIYYGKRLMRICQVPQMPYLENKKVRVVLYHLPKTGGRFIKNLKQLIQQSVISDFFPIRFKAKFVKKQIGIKIFVNFAAKRTIKIVFQTSVTKCNILILVGNTKIS